MGNSHDSILVFEYYTASGINDIKIISEAVALIESLLNDLNSFASNSSPNIHFLVSKDFSYIGDSFGFSENNENKIVIDISLEEWLEKNVRNFDGCIFISAEEDMNLYNLTKILENNNVKVYGSDSNSTLLCSNKYNTFKHLRSVINQPKTFKFTVCDDNLWEESIKNILESLQNKNSSNQEEFKLIVKPLYGVDCQDMVIISDEYDITNISKIFPKNSEILVQEFIYGENLSVSLISDGKIAIPLTLNKQYLEINKKNQQYLGGELPINHPLKEDIFRIAKKAVQAIDGIKGFVGVDLIIQDLDNIENIYFLEINSRFTTPYVGISKIANFSIGKTIIELLDNKLSIDSIYNNVEADFNINNNTDASNFNSSYVKFRKNGYNLDIEVL